MDESPATAPAPAAPPAPRSIGERLRAGREKAGLSVPAAAEKLHLDAKVIEALEADRFAELGASVYVRGHLRRYGDFVGEAGSELVDMYAARDVKRPPPPDLTQVPQAAHRADAARLKTPAIGLASAIVLAAAIWWVLAGSRPHARKPSAPPSVPAASTVSTSSAAAGSPAPPALDQAPVSRPALSATPVSLSSTAAPVDSGAAAKREDVAPARETHLTLTLTNDSWIEVYDGRGQRLYYDVATAGSVQSVAGRGPLRVVLGNSSGVSVEVDGEKREIPASARDGEGARFVVNRSGSLARAR